LQTAIDPKANEETKKDIPVASHSSNDTHPEGRSPEIYIYVSKEVDRIDPAKCLEASLQLREIYSLNGLQDQAITVRSWLPYISNVTW